MPIVVQPAAAADIDEAFLWYEGRREGLGFEFLAAVQSTLDAIISRPTAYQVVHRDTRRALLRRFPYAIFFRIYDDIIIVVACMHARRHPGQWKSRS